MIPALQFTLSQVASQLGLSDSVVSRLSKIFGLPLSCYKDFYEDENLNNRSLLRNRSRFTLFQERDLEILLRIKQLLVEGRSLSEIKPIITGELNALNQPYYYNYESVCQNSEDKSPELLEYEEDNNLKEYLAEVTFDHYRQVTASKKAPLESLFRKLEEHKRKRSEGSCKIPSEESDQIFNPATLFSTSVLDNQKSWLSQGFRERILTLQKELLLKLRD